jgi:two-component system sensor histidine kinase RegB
MEGPARDRPQPARVGAVVSRTSARMSGSWLVPTRRPAIPARAAVNLDWLIRLRWAQIVGQAVTIVATHVVAVPVPLAPLAALVAVGLLANVVLGLVVAPRAASGALLVRDVHLAGVMALDIGLLTGMLYLTGGPLNPFGSLYLVQIALATVVLPAAWAWALVALSFAGFGALLVEHRPLLMPDATRMIGMWVALGVAAAFIVYFLWRITTALAEREAELTLARNLTARQEKLASLATMAAGAAHELSTPLSTVALVAKELERHLAGPIHS